MARGTALVGAVDLDLGDGRGRFRVLAAAFGLLTLITAAIAHGSAPDALAVAFLVLVLCCVAAIVRPVAGVYMIVLLSLVGDSQTTAWWPFTKNMSSRESIFFVSDSLSITPLEVLLAVTYLSLLLHRVANPAVRFHRGRLFWPVGVLLVFTLIGFAKGYSTGGSSNVAILEVRPLLYICLLYVLVVNVLRSRQQYRTVFALAVAAVCIQCLMTLDYYMGLTPSARDSLESLSEHSATVTMNVLFVFLLALLAYGGTRWKVWLMFVLAVPVMTTFLLSQRRAAMVALFGGVAVLFGVLYRRQRRTFWIALPPVLVIGALFVAATWNAAGAIGLPAAAVKSVLFPDSLSATDQSSDLYRQIEAYNLWFTIRSSPVTGFGFGHPFAVVVPMPDISFFAYWQYLPHNSVLWVWIKLGFFGFVAFLFTFARTVQRGATNALRAARPDDAAMVTAALAYVVMFIVFAYVDIIWDARPAVMLALSLALCADFNELPDRRNPAPPLISDDPHEPLLRDHHDLAASRV